MNKKDERKISKDDYVNDNFEMLSSFLFDCFDTTNPTDEEIDKSGSYIINNEEVKALREVVRAYKYAKRHFLGF